MPFLPCPLPMDEEIFNGAGSACLPQKNGAKCLCLVWKVSGMPAQATCKIKIGEMSGGRLAAGR